MFSNGGISGSREWRLLPSSTNGCNCSHYLEKRHRILPNSLQWLPLPVISRGGIGWTLFLDWRRWPHKGWMAPTIQILFGTTFSSQCAGFLHMNFTNEFCQVRRWALALGQAIPSTPRSNISGEWCLRVLHEPWRARRACDSSRCLAMGTPATYAIMAGSSRPSPRLSRLRSTL